MELALKQKVMDHIRRWPAGFKIHTLKGPISKEFALSEVDKETDLGRSIMEIEIKVMESEEKGFQ
jgi:hypothetical protein